jgi:uncharacterized protein
MTPALRVNAIELLRQPGSQRAVDADTTVADLGIDDHRFVGTDAVHATLRLDVLTDGVVVSGQVRSTWHGACRRCANPAQGTLECEVHELYQRVVTDPDAFELGDLLDLEPMVREVLLLDAPLVPLCRPDCQGLCPQCGVDRNVETCQCDTTTPDPRWAALEQFRGMIDD